MPSTLGLVIIAAGSVLLVAVSWRSFCYTSSHGFFRFFAFEAVLCLIVVNARYWFHRPGSPLQLVSWVFLAASALLAVHGFRLLRQLGRPRTPDARSPLFCIENTATLVTAGAYRFIRHPLYASVLYAACGAALKALSLLTATLALVAFGFLLVTARAEEVENVSRFGQPYRDYIARTRLFIPFVLQALVAQPLVAADPLALAAELDIVTGQGEVPA